jgi:FkbM family methyltransferase
MSMLQQACTKLTRKISHFYKLYVLRDPFLWTVKKWFADHGDETLRLDYPLDKSSVVFDVGGYLGDYADAIHKKYGCRIYLFEPVPAFYDQCVERFSNNSSITCLNYGLSSASGWFEMNLNNNESSFKKIEDGSTAQQAQVRSITEVVAELGIKEIDLIKINIEGGEFDLLPIMIESGLVKRIKYIQVQFHNFIAGAVDGRLSIRRSLESTHREMWNYEFVWESWELF